MKDGRNLTERERKYFEHVQRAYSRGQSLAQYCRDAEIDVKDLYSAKQQLLRKGALPESDGRSKQSDRRSELIPVRVIPAPSPISGPVCRLRHPSGWQIECSSWPEVSWLAEVFGKLSHAAP
jgi:hypothetical protein